MKIKFTVLVGMFMAGVLFQGQAWGQAPEVAVLDSHNTRNFFALHYPPCSPPSSYTLGAEEYQRYFRGWEFVLHTNTIPYAIIQDAEIEKGNLDKYKLLILSNTTSLSDEQEKAVSQWVRKGGRLIATFGTGYKDIVSDPRQLDGLKLQKGGTSALHHLWHDPLSKLFTTLAFSPGIDVKITQYSGPTSGLFGRLNNDVLPYGALANVLVQRPLHHGSAYGFLVVPGYDRPAPAILVEEAAHGSVIYFSFAPEYIVSKEFDLPFSLHCPDGQNWAGRSLELRTLMRDSIIYMLSSPDRK